MWVVGRRIVAAQGRADRRGLLLKVVVSIGHQ
jgi:hypothetical protein